MALKTNFDDLATFNTPQEILQAISDGVEDVAEPNYNGFFDREALKMGLPKEKESLFDKVQHIVKDDYTNKEAVVEKMSSTKENFERNITGMKGLTGDYTNKEEVLEKIKKPLGTGEFLKPSKNTPAFKLEKTKINSVKLDKLDKMMEDIDKAANGKITTHKPVSTIMNLPKKERAEVVKKLGLKLRDNLNKLNETLKNNPGKLNLNPFEKVQLELFMAKMNREGGPDKFVEQNFKLTQDELKQGKTKEDQIREEVLKENKVKVDKESPKKESILKDVKNENSKEATKAGSTLKENKATVKTLDLKTTEKTSDDLVAKASNTKHVKPVMSGPTVTPAAPTKNLNVGGRV